MGMGGTREKQGVTEGGDVPPLPLLTQTAGWLPAASDFFFAVT